MLERVSAERDRAGQAPGRERRQRLPRLEARERELRAHVAKLEAERAATRPPPHVARGELAAIESVLAERRALRITADRISPPAYITQALGERPRKQSTLQTKGGNR